MDSAKIEQLVQKEPWRTGQVWVADALDPAWVGERPLCDGDIQWSDSGKWWWCTSCGYCGFWGNTDHHRVKHPYETLMTYGALFIRKRAAQGMPAAQAVLQLVHAFSAVAKLMINTAPEDVVRIVERLREDV